MDLQNLQRRNGQIDDQFMQLSQDAILDHRFAHRMRTNSLEEVYDLTPTSKQNTEVT